MKYRTHYSQTTRRHYPTILLIFYSIQSPVQEARTELATRTNTPAQVFEWKFITEVYVRDIRVVRRIKRFFFLLSLRLLKLTMVVVTFLSDTRISRSSRTISSLLGLRFLNFCNHCLIHERFLTRSYLNDIWGDHSVVFVRGLALNYSVQFNLSKFATPLTFLLKVSYFQS